MSSHDVASPVSSRSPFGELPEQAMCQRLQWIVDTEPARAGTVAREIASNGLREVYVDSKWRLP